MEDAAKNDASVFIRLPRPLVEEVDRLADLDDRSRAWKLRKYITEGVEREKERSKIPN